MNGHYDGYLYVSSAEDTEAQFLDRILGEAAIIGIVAFAVSGLLGLLGMRNISSKLRAILRR